MQNLSKRQLINELWRRGNLTFFYKKEQLPFRDFILNSTKEINVANIHRQFGKSTATFAVYTEYCLRNPKVLVKFGAPTAKQVKEIVSEIYPKVFASCPSNLRPVYNKTDGQFEFHNGSKIKLIGVNIDKGDRLRGSAAHRVVLDEAGFMDNLEYVIETIILPFFTTTNGKLDIISTPSSSIAHDYVRKFIPQSKAMNSYYELPITKNVFYQGNKLEQIVSRFDLLSPNGDILKSGWENDNFKREYLCQIFNDQKSMIVPEWEVQEQYCIIDKVKPIHYDIMVGMDMGFIDHTGVLFGYLDFQNNQLIIEDEIFVNYKTPSDIGEMIVDKLQLHYNGVSYENIKFVADATPMDRAEIRKQSGIGFQFAIKTNFDANLALLRTKIGQARILINPRCQSLIQQLQQGNWNSNHTEWAKVEHLGHCDLIATLMYMVKMIDWNKNPEPNLRPKTTDSQFVRPDNKQYDDDNTFSLLKPKRK